MKKITLTTLTALGLIPFSLLANSHSLVNPLEDYRIIADIQQGEQLSGSIDAMLPFAGNDQHIWYGDLQAYQYAKQYQTIGIGGGYRGIYNNAIYGFYGFYDLQRSKTAKHYQRGSIGFERLSATWDVLANFNVYTFKDKTDLINQGIQSGYIDGNDIYFRNLYDTEKVHNGGKIEIGRSLGSSKLRGYVGAYKYGGGIAGGSLRLNLQINKRITLTAYTQRDSVRGWLTMGGIQYWFGQRNSYNAPFNLTQRLRDPVVRDMTIANSIEFNRIENVLDSRKIYFASPNVSSDQAGTANDPTSLSNAISRAGDNDIIYLTNGNGAAYDLGGTITPKSGQTIWGSGSNFSLQGITLRDGSSSDQPLVEGGTFSFTNAGTIGGIKMNGDGTAASAISVTNSSGIVTIDSMTFTGSYTTASILVNGSTANAAISNATVTNSSTGDAGLYLANGANATVGNSTFSNGAGIGIRIVSGSTATITNTIISSNTLDGLAISNSGSIATLSGSNAIINNTRNGIFATNGAIVNMTGGSIASNLGDAAEVQSNAVINFTNPFNLLGTIRRDDFGSETSQINLNGVAQFTTTPGQLEIKTCTTDSSGTTCT